ncbi:hypothetical protein HAX54_033932 [Datura stramonium]|uniref:Protein kinase domain-containing protein n=1 Tax=Datura stramonium TaxID=4076 RepID=A0ABS8VFR5_DATST|nr:hypothetical protein [Datura stramonium]
MSGSWLKNIWENSVEDVVSAAPIYHLSKVSSDKSKSRGSHDPKKDPAIPKDGPTAHIAAQTFTFRELAAATKNFRPECLLGEGGFGRVYKGRLESTGQVVAVKQLDRNGLQGNREFLVEVLMLSLLHHPNLVNLISCVCRWGPTPPCLRVYAVGFFRGSFTWDLIDLWPPFFNSSVGLFSECYPTITGNIWVLMLDNASATSAGNSLRNLKEIVQNNLHIVVDLGGNDYEKDTKDMIEVAVSSSGKLGLELKDYGSIIYVQDMEKECNEHGLAGVDCITERKGG